MVRFIVAAAALLLAQIIPGMAARAETLALVGGTLVDGTLKAPIRNSVILVENERIVAVGTVDTLAVPADAKRISTEGMTVLPGLWDMHVHLMLTGHSVYEHWQKTYPDQFRDVIMPASAKQLLMAGITGARDLGAALEDSIAVRDAIKAGKIPGPTLFVSGPFIQKKPYPGTERYRWGVSSPEDARAKIRRIAKAGVDLVKLIDVDEMSEGRDHGDRRRGPCPWPAGGGPCPSPRGNPPWPESGRRRFRAYRPWRSARIPQRRDGHAGGAHGAQRRARPAVLDAHRRDPQQLSRLDQQSRVRGRRGVA
ncbi:amidohydrolase family protein [Sphingobium lignivorans]|uniref:Amidohydrolase-related domain-containing protein n=1 Tax=Sphingobium lignivorans TaxID=2735886 RepID=A0ABR6NCD6_9SPHN|nr:amidohydrolase family protein [Sphingobium lignivorans]MBB5984726.1 hypothetical protein [Sphingobium lignivorans]